MAVVRGQETLRTWWKEPKKRIILNLPNSSLKTFETRRLLCKHSSNADSSPSPITGKTSEIFGNTWCRTDAVIISTIANCVRNNMYL